MLVGNGLNSSSGLHIVVDHQHINDTSFVLSGFRLSRLSSQSLPGHQHPSEHAVHPKYPTRKRPGDPGRSGPCRQRSQAIPRTSPLPMIYIHPRSPTQSSAVTLEFQKPTTPASCEPPSFDIAGEERAPQAIVEEVLAQGVWITRARRLRGQELVELRPSNRHAVTAALSRKECKRAATVIKVAVMKVLAKRK